MFCSFIEILGFYKKYNKILLTAVMGLNQKLKHDTTISQSTKSILCISGLSEEKEDKGKLDISCVNVEGASTCLSRDEAAEILAATGEYKEGAEPDTSVDTWHYAHLKN